MEFGNEHFYSIPQVQAPVYTISNFSFEQLPEKECPPVFVDCLLICLKAFFFLHHLDHSWYEGCCLVSPQFHLLQKKKPCQAAVSYCSWLHGFTLFPFSLTSHQLRSKNTLRVNPLVNKMVPMSHIPFFRKQELPAYMNLKNQLLSMLEK